MEFKLVWLIALLIRYNMNWMLELGLFSFRVNNGVFIIFSL